MGGPMTSPLATFTSDICLRRVFTHIGTQNQTWKYHIIHWRPTSKLEYLSLKTCLNTWPQNKGYMKYKSSTYRSEVEKIPDVKSS